MRKAEKRALGRARQEQNLLDSQRSGLSAQERDRKRREARATEAKRQAERAKVKQEAEKLGITVAEFREKMKWFNTEVEETTVIIERHQAREIEMGIDLTRVKKEDAK